MLECGKHGFIGDRDVTATLNIYIKYASKSKYSRCGVSGVALNAPKPGEKPERDAG